MPRGRKPGSKNKPKDCPKVEIKTELKTKATQESAQNGQIASKLSLKEPIKNFNAVPVSFDGKKEKKLDDVYNANNSEVENKETVEETFEETADGTTIEANTDEEDAVYLDDLIDPLSNKEKVADDQNSDQKHKGRQPKSDDEKYERCDRCHKIVKVSMIKIRLSYLTGLAEYHRAVKDNIKLCQECGLGANRALEKFLLTDDKGEAGVEKRIPV